MILVTMYTNSSVVYLSAISIVQTIQRPVVGLVKNEIVWKGAVMK